MKLRHSKLRDFLKWWSITQCIDFIFLLGMCFQQCLFGLEKSSSGAPSMSNSPSDKVHSYLWIAFSLIISGILAVTLLYTRERLYFWLLQHRIPKSKVEGNLSRETWLHVLKTALFTQTSFFILNVSGYIAMVQPTWTWEFWFRVYVEFYCMLVLRDFFSLAPFHHLMHTPDWYFLHKNHHTVRKNAQSLHAFHIDLLDLVLENTGAPSLLLLGQYSFGFDLGVHWFAVAMLTCHDGSLHSVNPYSSMYFNPILDYLLKGNICHQLHHALNKGYLLFVPYRHLWSSAARRADVEKYNMIFKTDYSF